MFMSASRLLFPFLWLTIGMLSAQAQEFTYPFVNGIANLPPLTCESQQTVACEFVVTNPGSKMALIVIKVENLPDSIRLYRIQNKKMILLDQAGQLMANPPRPVEATFRRDKELVIGTVKQGQSACFRVYLTNHMRTYPKTFRIQLYTPERYRASEAVWFYDSERHQQVIEVFFWGVISIMVLFTCLQYILLRDIQFLYYALYLFLTLIRLLLTNETIVLDGWPGLRAIGFTSRFSLTALLWSLCAYSLFFRAYVETDIRAPQSDRISRWLGWILFGLGVLDIFVTIQRVSVSFWVITYQFIEVSLIGFGVLHLWILWRNYDQNVKYIFWGIVMLLIGGLASLINQRFPDLAGAETRDRLIWIAAYMAEFLSFSLGLINRQLTAQQEQVQVQATLIEQLQENQRKQQQLLKIRSEIARDLHDELGSELSGINILSQIAVERLASQPAFVQLTLATIGDTSRQVMDRMRDIVWNLSLHHLYTDDLTEQITALTTSVLEHSAISLKLTIPPNVPASILPPDHWRHLSMIYKEALHNVVKHARATELTVQFRIDEGIANLIIEDNGVGFLKTNIALGNGLANQKHRAGILKGSITVTSQPGSGTRIHLTFPLHADLLA
ncbi:sensor histidine kinase [Dyadobacter arcticus]|uniref:Signal transduction histidine kinase n=1 Tax=Dyadobacter arcticus TaxID=1078754 RepID=A0ABX0ULW0_9BACT|nr:7TM diverse intracellular signaling domain-containing protein [Dyadobacter arcticus]NIJ52620.1 signal transduction histidine kinase [Dyadobacter arcticus]